MIAYVTKTFVSKSLCGITDNQMTYSSPMDFRDAYIAHIASITLFALIRLYVFSLKLYICSLKYVAKMCVVPNRVKMLQNYQNSYCVYFLVLDNKQQLNDCKLDKTTICYSASRQ